MRATLSTASAVLTRELGDRALAKESTTAYHMKRLLNAQGFHFTRMNPSRHGLTGCTVGLWDRRARIILWHDRYAIELAHKAYNAGCVRFSCVAMEGI